MNTSESDRSRMAAYLLDTNHASCLVTPGHHVQLRFYERLSAGDRFALCVPVLTETLYGISVTPRAAQNRVEWEQLYPLLDCYIPDETDGIAAAMLQVLLRRQGWQLKTVDALIAAVALHHDLILLPTDRDFLAVPKLRCENWLSST